MRAARPSCCWRWLLAAVLLVVSAETGLLAGKAAPRPVDADGRELTRLALLPTVDDRIWIELTDLGFVMERNARGEVIAWLSDEEIDKLAALEIPWRALEPPTRPPAPSVDTLAMTYHDWDALTAALQQIADDHPAITRLISAGTSVQGRDLWWMLITDNPDLEEDESGFKYVSTMHGDEPVGTETCLALIDELTDGYGSDPRLTRLVDEVEIWIMPMMNPDGNHLGQRSNAQGIDLNRDFPDKWDSPVNTPEGRAVETGVVMNWQAAHSTSLSANFHAGALVVNYHYDNNETGSSVYTACPDDDIVIDLALEYSEDNEPMYNGSFSQGITNGADWYAVSGGMQDWNYDYEGDIEFTIELNNTKWPPASQLEVLWNDNRESMLSLLERALTGVRGGVTDAETGAPVAARLHIAGRGITFYADPSVGDYHRNLPAGSFDLVVGADGYETRTVPVTVSDPEAEAVRVDVSLTPRATDLQPTGYRVAEDDGGDGWLDAGESGRLAVTLENGGAGATGIGGELLSIDGFATATGRGTWPDLGPGQEAESEPSHLALAVDPATPPGHLLGFAVSWETAEGPAGTSDAFFVPVSAPATVQTASTDVPQAIEDYSTVTSTIEIVEDALLDEVNVGVQITHTYVADLRIILIGPDGTEVRLHDRSGGSADDIDTWYDTLTPSVDDLGILAGTATAGTWTLRVEDLAGGDQGSLDAWTLEQISRPFEDPVAEVHLRSVSRTATDGVALEWWPVGSATSYRVYRSPDPSSESSFDDVTGADPDPTDSFHEDHAAGSFLCWIVTAVGHTGEGLWGHFGH